MLGGNSHISWRLRAAEGTRTDVGGEALIATPAIGLVSELSMHHRVSHANEYS